jgi:HAD superfamily hydrolase (TIGR01509 family)
LLEVSGGKERIRAHWQSRGDMPRDIGGGLDDTIARIHELKTAAYEQAVQDGRVALRPGVLELMFSALEADMRLAIATTTSPVNITYLLRRCVGPHWREMFSVIEDASTAPRKKPDPLVYQQTLQRLRIPAVQALAFEDSANGLQAARQAGLATVITPNGFTVHHDFTDALRVLPNLQDVTLAKLRQWHAMPSSD